MGEFSSGGLLTLTQADAPYTIRWNSTDTTTCNETLEITSSGQILNGAHGFPQGLLSGSSTIDPALIEPGDYTYRISCNGGAANDFVNVDVTATGIPSAFDLKIKLASESTYHDYPAGKQSPTGSFIDIGAVTVPAGNSILCAPGNPCEANQTVDLNWVGTNVSNCNAIARYKLSNDLLPAWNTLTAVASTGQLTMNVTHLGTTRFTITCDKPDGTQLSDVVYAEFQKPFTIPSYTPTLAQGDFYVPENVGSLYLGMGSSGGRGGTTSATGADGDIAYFNKDNGTSTGADYLVAYPGHGGGQSVAMGGTASGGIGGSIFYPVGNIAPYYGASGIYLLVYIEGVAGASTTTASGGAGGLLQNGNEVIVTGSASVGISGASPMDGATGAVGGGALTGGGGGGSGSYMLSQFSVTPLQKFKFKAPIKPPFGTGTINMNIKTWADTSFGNPY